MNDTGYGSFISTTQIWDVSQIYAVDLDNKEHLRELLVRMYINLNLMAIVLNTKDTAYYDTTEFVNGQLLFPNPNYNSQTATQPDFRQIFRKVINFGPIALVGLNQQRHGITVTPTTTFTRIYGVANNLTSGSFIPLPFVGITANENIILSVDDTYVDIFTLMDYSAYTIVYVVLEYCQT